MHCGDTKFSVGTINIRIVKKQQGYCSGGYAIRQHKVSGTAIRDPRLIPINQKIGSNRIEKILIFSSGRLQISRNISLVGTEL